MTVYQNLKTALDEIGIPVERDYYTGPAEAYITVNIFDERPGVFGDCEDEAMAVTLDVDLWCRKDPSEYKRKIRKILREQNFAIVSINSFYENEENYYHVVFRAETDENMEEF